LTSAWRGWRERALLWRGMRRSLPAAAAAALIGGTTVLAFETGGYFDRARLIAGVVAWALVVLAALTASRPLPSSGPGRAALAGLALLAVWTGVSLLWAPIAGYAEDDLQRVLLYLGFFWAAIVFLRGAGVQRWFEPAIALGVLVVVSYALSERLLPGVVELQRSYTSAGRLEQPLTYWNATGIVAAVGLLLCIRIAGDPGRPIRLRVGAAAAGVPIGLGLYLTFARGALASLAVGLLVLVALAPAVRSQLRSIVCVVGAAGVASLVASALPAVKSLGRGEEGEPTQGLVMLAALLMLGAAAGVVVIRRPRRHLPSPRLPASRPTTVLGAAALVLLAGLVTVALLEGKPQGVSPRQRADPGRLTSVDTNRYRYWEVAVGAFVDHPVAGLGSGGFAVEWLKQQDREDQAHDAHSLYLETGAELGLAGLAFLALFVGGVVAAVVRLYRRNPALATGLSAALAAWACHAGLDWDWEMPAATLPALLLGAAAIAWSEQLTSRAEGPHRSAEAPAIPAPARDRARAAERTV
jgi:O-Antigen ligase